ncbi:MAG: hypothetical protein IJ572_05190 [Bacilli bacterium]|nr:hypothetical protein [Bacilli bacterium]
MKSINISKRKFENLKQLELPKEVVSTEASFYRFNYLGKIKVFKSLHKTSGPIFANKLFTLEMLNEYQEILPNSFVIPESLVSVDKELRGFSLPFIKGYNFEVFLKNPKISNKVKIHFMKKIGDILEQLSHIRNNSALDCIYINDLHASNFIADVKNDELKVVDIDSSRICDSKPFPARYLTPLSLLNKAPGNSKYEIYQKVSEEQLNSSILDMMTYDNYEDYYCMYNHYRNQLGYINSNQDSDLYCYIILFLNFLYGSNVGSFSLEEFYNYMYYLEKLNIDRNLLNAIYLIVTSAPNENIEEYLDTLSDEQIKKSHKDNYIKYKKLSK